MGIRKRRGGGDPAVGDIDEHCARRFGPEVYADGVMGHPVARRNGSVSKNTFLSTGCLQIKPTKRGMSLDIISLRLYRLVAHIIACTNVRNVLNGRTMAREPDDLLGVVARLYYVDQLPEREVANLVGVSRSRVSRLLTRARERGVVRITVGEYDPCNRRLEDLLKQRYRLNHAVVVKTPRGGAIEHVRRSIGYFAGPPASQWIGPGDIIGVAGGRTLAELIRFMAPSAETKGVTVVQLMGNIGPSVAATDAVELSRMLVERFRGTLYTVNAPAFVRDRLSRDVFHNHEHVRSVWQLFDRMRIALVGIGTLADSLFIERSVLDRKDLASLAAAGAVGEICGRFFDVTGRECDTDYRRRVISIDLDTLRQKTQVIGVTHGRDRAIAVRAALDGGILKSLIIDEDGAEAALDGALERSNPGH